MINCKELSSYTTRFCSPAIGVESFTVTLNSCEGLVTVCPFLDVVVILNWKFKTISSKVLFCFNPSSVETSPNFGWSIFSYCLYSYLPVVLFNTISNTVLLPAFPTILSPPLLLFL
jgi:hypothetical protein